MSYSIEGTQQGCYPDSTVLINKLDIREQKKLDIVERQLVLLNSAKIELETVFENVDFTFYKNLHKQLFNELYEWAGTVRSINISKKGTVFCDCKLIEQNAEAKFKRLAKLDYLKGMTFLEFIDELVELYNDLNYLHPFREGNGRTLRLFVSLLVRNAGYNISYANCDSDLMMIATIKASQGDLTLLKEVFGQIVSAE